MNTTETSKRLYSLEEVREAITPEELDDPDFEQNVINVFREEVDMDKAAELVATIIEVTEKDANKDPVSAEAYQSWDTITRFLWIAKEAYCLGMLRGFKISQALTVNNLQGMEAK